MGYIVLYNYLSTTGDYDSWEERCDEFETYEEMIKCMAKWHSYDHEFIAIYKTEDNMLDLYIEDIQKEHTRLQIELIEKIHKKKELEAKLAEERAERERIQQTEREIALLRELIKKYGVLV